MTQAIKDYTKEEDQRQNKDIKEIMESQNRILKQSIDLRFEQIQEQIDSKFLLLQKNLTLQFKTVIRDKKSESKADNVIEKKKEGNFISKVSEQASLEILVSPRNKLGNEKSEQKQEIKSNGRNLIVAADSKALVARNKEEIEEKVPPIVPKLNIGVNRKESLSEVKSDSNSHLWDDDSDEVMRKKHKHEKNKKKQELKMRESAFSDDSFSTPKRKGNKKPDPNHSQRNIKRPSHAFTSKNHPSFVQMKRSETMEVSDARGRPKSQLKISKKRDLRIFGVKKEPVRKASWQEAEAPLETEEDRLKQDTARDIDI